MLVAFVPPLISMVTGCLSNSSRSFFLCVFDFSSDGAFEAFGVFDLARKGGLYFL